MIGQQTPPPQAPPPYYLTVKVIATTFKRSPGLNLLYDVLH